MQRRLLGFLVGALGAGLLFAVACGSDDSAGGSLGGDAGEPPVTCDSGCIDGQVASGPPGQLDPSFGADVRKRGVTQVPITNEFRSSSRWVGMQRAADGGIYVVYTGDNRTGVARLRPDGKPDDAYGNEGGIGLATVAGVTQAFGVDASGRVTLVQPIAVNGGAPSGYSLMRLAPDGRVDNAFGSSGKAGPFANAPLFYPHFVVPRADDKVLLVGFADGAPGASFVVHGPDGALDAAFGTKTDRTAPASPTDVSILADGSLVVLTSLSDAATSSTSASVRHYDINGVLDTSFGAGGAVTVPLPENGGRETTGALGSAAPGAGVVYGFAVRVTGDAGYTGAMRLTAQGAPDTTFGPGGVTATPSNTTVGDPSVSAAVAAGDRIAIGGIHQTGLGSGAPWLAEIATGTGVSADFDQGVAADGGFASAPASEVDTLLREPGSGKLLVGGRSGNGYYVSRVFP